MVIAIIVGSIAVLVLLGIVLGARAKRKAREDAEHERTRNEMIAQHYARPSDGQPTSTRAYEVQRAFARIDAKARSAKSPARPAPTATASTRRSYDDSSSSPSYTPSFDFSSAFDTSSSSYDSGPSDSGSSGSDYSGGGGDFGGGGSSGEW